jgi:hypothetical protein
MPVHFSSIIRNIRTEYARVGWFGEKPGSSVDFFWPKQIIFTIWKTRRYMLDISLPAEKRRIRMTEADIFGQVIQLLVGDPLFPSVE